MIAFLPVIIFSLASLGAEEKSEFKKSSLNPSKKDDLRLNLFLPGVQMRYQDTASQSQELVNHYTYSVSAQFNDGFLLGFEYLSSNENTGNESFSIDRKFTEEIIFLGFTALKKDFLVSGQHLVEFMLTPELVFGQSSNKVTTALFSQSQSINSGREMAYGFGLIGSARIGYLIAESDFRYQTSKNYEPGSLLLGSVRIGANFSF
jgi:hypothetical protein